MPPTFKNPSLSSLRYTCISFLSHKKLISQRKDILILTQREEQPTFIQLIQTPPCPQFPRAFPQYGTKCSFPPSEEPSVLAFQCRTECSWVSISWFSQLCQPPLAHTGSQLIWSSSKLPVQPFPIPYLSPNRPNSCCICIPHFSYLSFCYCHIWNIFQRTWALSINHPFAEHIWALCLCCKTHFPELSKFGQP